MKVDAKGTVQSFKEAVEVDGRYKGFKEALKRLTYEKLKKIHKIRKKNPKTTAPHDNRRKTQGDPLPGAPG